MTENSSSLSLKMAATRAARRKKIAERCQRDLACPVMSQKIFHLSRRANQRYNLARLTRQEGRLAIVTNVRWDAVDADVPLTNGTDSGRRSRVVLAPRCWRQALRIVP
jgi:hypothetical protein